MKNQNPCVKKKKSVGSKSVCKKMILLKVIYGEFIAS